MTQAPRKLEKVSLAHSHLFQLFVAPGEPFLPFRSRWRTPQYREATVSAPPQVGMGRTEGRLRITA